MKRTILKHLGYSSESVVDEKINILIDKALESVEKLSEFKYVYAPFHVLQPFMLRHPEYLRYFKIEENRKDTTIFAPYLLISTTLGIQIDRQLQRLSLIDMTCAVIFDTVANVFLEQKADEFEKTLKYEKQGFRFCPGYGGTPLTDNQEIARLVRADRIGISFLQSGLMVPLKSMAGIIRIGGSVHKSCVNCIMQGSCDYRKRGTFCYTP